MVEWQHAFAGLGFAHGDAGALDEPPQRVARVAVDDPAAGDDERPDRGTEHGGGPIEGGRVGARARHVPGARFEQLAGKIEGLGLYVLRQRQRHRPRIGRRGQHAHRLHERRRQLLGTVEAIPEARDGLEAVVHGNIERRRRFELLQHGRGAACGKDVARQQEHRKPVDRGARGRGEHVRGARADRRGARERLQPVPHLRERRCRVHHRLLVARQHELEAIARGQQRFAQTGDVPVPENAEHAGEQRLRHAVALAALCDQKLDDGLADGQATDSHFHPPR